MNTLARSGGVRRAVSNTVGLETRRDGAAAEYRIAELRRHTGPIQFSPFSLLHPFRIQSPENRVFF